VRGPLRIGVKTDSHERRNMGLRMDRLTVSVASGSLFKLTDRAGLRLLLTLALLFAGVWLLSESPLAAGIAALVWAAGFAALASADLFLAWRLTSLMPGMIVFGTLVLFLARVAAERVFGLDRTVARGLGAAALVVMVLRLALVSHPDFYYPDLLTHARVVEAIRSSGPSFFLHPADALSAQGAWTKPVLGGVSALPYAVMFHAPFAVIAGAFSLSMDEIETALKAVSCLVSVLPVLLAGALAARFSLPPLGALLLCLIPTYASRLSYALLPALWGHAFDLAALLVIATLLDLDGLKSRRSMAGAALALLIGHLAYTSSVVNEGAFAAVLVVTVALSGAALRASAPRIALAEALAALLAFALYYRHFVGDVLGLFGRLLGLGPGAPGAPASVYPVESFWAVLFERTNSFFGWPWILLALAGLWLSGPGPARAPVVRAWGLTYLLLILLRARIPDVFRYGHETLFLTPLVAILAGSALILAWRKGGAFRIASALAGAGLLVASGLAHWSAFREQLANAL
jgi:hypothetical protein